MTSSFWRVGRRWVLGLGASLLAVWGGGEAAAQDEIHVANFEANTITTYPRTGSGDQPPLRTLAGPNTGLTGPVVVHIDVVHDEMVVVSPGGLGFPSILVYPRSASGDTPPLRKIQGLATRLDGPVDVAVDVIRDEMVVVNSGTPNSITVYRRTDDGDVAPLRTITGPNTGFGLIQGVVIDPINDELVVGDVGAAIRVFPRAAEGNVMPKRALTGQHTGLTSPLTAIIDLVRDEMWVVDGANRLNLYPRTASGDTPPLRTIQGGLTKLTNPLDGMLDQINDELIVANSSSNAVTVYRRTAFADAPPLREISGHNTGLGNPQGLFAVTSAPLVGALLPTSRSVQQNSAATVFATMINPAAGPAQACFPWPITPVPAIFAFQTTSALNLPVGTANTPANVPAGGSQSFILVFLPTDAFAPLLVEIAFVCDAVSRASTIKGVTTVLLSASAQPVADVIALAATIGNTGIVDVPGPDGTGAFSVATANVGQAGALITVTADTGGASLPVSLLVCQTNPQTGACLLPPAASVSVQIGPGATPTFSIFAVGRGVIQFDPANNRVTVHFTEGVTERGSTTVAIRTNPLAP